MLLLLLPLQPLPQRCWVVAGAAANPVISRLLSLSPHHKEGGSHDILTVKVLLLC